MQSFIVMIDGWNNLCLSQKNPFSLKDHKRFLGFAKWKAIAVSAPSSIMNLLAKEEQEYLNVTAENSP
jgi:hypothetical protein